MDVVVVIVVVFVVIMFVFVDRGIFVKEGVAPIRF